MFCTKCGNQVPEGQNFCSACGNPMAPAQQPQQPQQPQFQQPQYAQPQYGQPQYAQQPQYGQPQYQQPVNNVLGMNWFKFLIYFALFASALFNIIGAIPYFTGSNYTFMGFNYSTSFYMVFPFMQFLDILQGIIFIGLAGLAIYTRFRLAGFYKNAPMFINILYIANVALSVLSIIVAAVFLGQILEELVGVVIVASMPALIASIVIAVVNYVYFKKRSHLFTR